MRSWFAGLAVVVGCAGCGAEPDAAAPVAAPEPDPIVLSPDAVLADVTAEAAAAWSEALGVDFVLGEGGIPLISTAERDMWTPCVVDGKAYSCLPSGKYEDGVIRIRDTANCPLRTTAHEIGHAIARDPHAHAPAPSLMQANPDRGCSWDGVVDQGAIALIK